MTILFSGSDSKESDLHAGSPTITLFFQKLCNWSVTPFKDSGVQLYLSGSLWPSTIKRIMTNKNKKKKKKKRIKLPCGHKDYSYFYGHRRNPYHNLGKARFGKKGFLPQ